MDPYSSIQPPTRRRKMPRQTLALSEDSPKLMQSRPRWKAPALVWFHVQISWLWQPGMLWWRSISPPSLSLSPLLHYRLHNERTSGISSYNLMNHHHFPSSENEANLSPFRHLWDRSEASIGPCLSDARMASRLLWSKPILACRLHSVPSLSSSRTSLLWDSTPRIWSFFQVRLCNPMQVHLVCSSLREFSG